MKENRLPNKLSDEEGVRKMLNNHEDAVRHFLFDDRISQSHAAIDILPTHDEKNKRIVQT